MQRTARFMLFVNQSRLATLCVLKRLRNSSLLASRVYALTEFTHTFHLSMLIMGCCDDTSTGQLRDATD